jgi:hypothetical protein
MSMRSMNRMLAALAAAAIVTGGAVAASAPATAQDEVGVCVPVAASTETVVVEPAWEETVNHPAVGEPTIPNPDYVPERTETVVVTPAVPEVPEESHVDYTYEKHVWIITWVGTGQTKVHHSDKGAYYAEGVVRWIKTGETRHVTQEYVPGRDAVTEEVTHPAVGEPTIPNPDYVPGADPVGEPTIPNPDYVPPRSEVVQHDAVTEQAEHPAIQCRDDVAVTVLTRCYDGEAGIVVRVDNGTGAPLTVRSGPTSSVTWSAVDVEPGASLFRTFLQGSAALPDGKVVVALRNAGGYWTVTERYAALDCAVTPDTEEPGAEEPPSAEPVDDDVVTAPSTKPSASLVTTPRQQPALQPAVVNPADEVDAAENGETYDAALATTGASPVGIVASTIALLVIGTFVVAMAAHRREG